MMTLRSFVVGALIGACGTAGAHAQTIRGQVLEEVTLSPVAGAAVTVRLGTREVLRTTTDERGMFTAGVSSAGTYSLSIAHLSYQTVESEVEVRRAELVEIALRVSPTAMPLQPLQVEARRSDPRHDATWEGFLARRDRLPPIGRAGAIRWDDPEMINAMSVEDVLLWVDPWRGRERISRPVSEGITVCLVVLVNGRPMDLRGENVFEWSAQRLDAVEYYRYWVDAPLDYRAYSGGCGVLALWLRRR
jgi:hypothetical protein